MSNGKIPSKIAYLSTNPFQVSESLRSDCKVTTKRKTTVQVYNKNITMAKIMLPIACHLWNLVPIVLYLWNLRKLTNAMIKWKLATISRASAANTMFNSKSKNRAKTINPQETINKLELAIT